jgi:hypothetical protein
MCAKSDSGVIGRGRNCEAVRRSYLPKNQRALPVSGSNRRKGVARQELDLAAASIDGGGGYECEAERVQTRDDAGLALPFLASVLGAVAGRVRSPRAPDPRGR